MASYLYNMEDMYIHIKIILAMDLYCDGFQEAVQASWTFAAFRSSQTTVFTHVHMYIILYHHYNGFL